MTSAPSQSLKELSDSETPSAIGPCIEDDKEFIRNARARTAHYGRMIKGGKRAAFLWYALRWLPSSLRQRVFLELLQGSDDREDVWLWNERDEALLEWDEDWWDSPPPWQSAATALERRLSRTPTQTPQRREIQSAALEMRAAMIVWLALTSAVYKSADEERGARDREKWDMRGLISIWYLGLPWRVREWLDQHRNSYDDQKFTAVMDQAGHSCHHQMRKHVTCWLVMRSQLFPTQQDSIIYLGGDHCAPCLAHKPVPGSESPPSWTPSPALVALRFIWDDTEDRSDDIDASRDFAKWLSHQPIYGMKEVNDLFNSLPRNIDEDRYLSWVNAYPRWLRHTVTQYTLKEWQTMDSCIITLEHGGSLNIRSWWAAMGWSMMLPELSHSDRVKQFIDAWRYSVPWRWQLLPPPTPVPEFRDAIRVSGHTCWEEPRMDDYAAAMAFLEEDPKVVGIDMRKDSECQVCRLQWRLMDWRGTLPAEEREFSAVLTEVLVMLGNECSRRNVSWNNILASVQHHDFDGPVPNSDHQEQRDLQHTLDDSIDQGNGMRTDHTDINVLHRGHSPIPRPVHLPEDITHMFHPHITIPYVQHHSTDSQNDHHFATATAITDGIQDQSNVQYPPFHDIQPPSYSNSTRSKDVNYSAYGQPWVPYDQPTLQDFEALQTQVPGRRSTPLLISELVNSSVEDGVTTRSRDPGATMMQDNLAALSVEQDTTTDKADLSKDDMIKEIRTFFTESFERLGVELHGTKRNKKLPWLQFDDTLEDEGIEMVNWPKYVLTPGKGSNSSKGLAGVPVRDLKKIYKAIHSDTAKLELRHIPGARKSGQAVSQQEFFAESSASGSRKRPRDAETDGDSRPKKQLVFKNIRFDGVMEAWKVRLHWFLELSLTLYRTD
ncbi:hypothetical protein C8J56DRAFT_1165539 [Mycena floridula]|nr:hypothetical protein C8J56DRAFT_1165539 [Mycena floridula]